MTGGWLRAAAQRATVVATVGTWSGRGARTCIPEVAVFCGAYLVRDDRGLGCRGGLAGGGPIRWGGATAAVGLAREAFATALLLLLALWLVRGTGSIGIRSRAVPWRQEGQCGAVICRLGPGFDPGDVKQGFLFDLRVPELGVSSGHEEHGGQRDGLSIM